MPDGHPVPDCRCNPGVAAGTLERKGDAEWTTAVHAPLHDIWWRLWRRHAGPGPVVDDVENEAGDMRFFHLAHGSHDVLYHGSAGRSLVPRQYCRSGGCIR